MSDIESTFWQSLDTSQVKVLGISVGENDEIAQMFAQSFGLTFPVLRDPTQTTYSAYRINGISPYPLDCIIDQAGIIRYLHTEYDPHYMLATIEQLFITNIQKSNKKNRLPELFNLQLYPNPTNSQVVINLSNIDDNDVNLEVYDITGRRVFSKSLSTEEHNKSISYRLDLTSNASGIYYITLSNGYFQETKKLILLR